MTRDEATAQLIDISAQLVAAITAVPIIAQVHDQKYHTAVADLLNDGHSATAAKEYVQSEKRDMAVALARVEALTERRALLSFLLQWDLCDTL